MEFKEALDIIEQFVEHGGDRYRARKAWETVKKIVWKLYNG